MRSFRRLPELIWVGLLSAVALPDAGGAEPVVELVTIGPDRAIETRFGQIEPAPTGRCRPPCCTVRVP